MVAQGCRGDNPNGVFEVLRVGEAREVGGKFEPGPSPLSARLFRAAVTGLLNLAWPFVPFWDGTQRVAASWAVKVAGLSKRASAIFADD